MKPILIIILLLATLFLFFLSISYLTNPLLVDSHEKVAFIIPHADDETIGAGGIISMLSNSGCKLHFDLMTSGNKIGVGTISVDDYYKANVSKMHYLGDIGNNTIKIDNYYNVNISKNVSEGDRKGIIREDSFKQVMKVINVTNYKTHGFDDGALTTDEVFSVMEELYLKDGYTTFYTTTGDGNPDHHACHEAMKKMKEKYPNLKYRQFPIYYYFMGRGRTNPTQPLNYNYIDVNVNKYGNMKKRMFSVYYNIHIILPSFYPHSDGLISDGMERIYY
ncbi:MAG: PIG-L family deacetylase [Methanobrevibacter sp.]|jgi:LmbE family N-acetylglucosaminyl deacetylase|nr:PIG-L family deacetylase [Candidatus Methanovirga basalitermitum]